MGGETRTQTIGLDQKLLIFVFRMFDFLNIQQNIREIFPVSGAAS